MKQTRYYHLIEKLVTTLKLFFEKCKYLGIAIFVSKSSRYVFNEQPSLKTTGLYGDLLFLHMYIIYIYIKFLFDIKMFPENIWGKTETGEGY